MRMGQWAGLLRKHSLSEQGKVLGRDWGSKWGTERGAQKLRVRGLWMRLSFSARVLGDTEAAQGPSGRGTCDQEALT